MKQGKYIAAVLSLYMAYGPAMAFAANTTTGSVGIVIEGDNSSLQLLSRLLIAPSQCLQSLE